MVYPTTLKSNDVGYNRTFRFSVFTNKTSENITAKKKMYMYIV